MKCPFKLNPVHRGPLSLRSTGGMRPKTPLHKGRFLCTAVDQKRSHNGRIERRGLMWITGVCQGVPQDDRYGVSQSPLSHLGESVPKKMFVESVWKKGSSTRSVLMTVLSRS